MNEKSEQNEQEMTAKLTSDNKLLKELVQIKNRELDMMRWKLKLPAVTIDLERATIWQCNDLQATAKKQDRENTRKQQKH